MKILTDFLRASARYLCPGIIFKMPAGIVADPVADFGYFAMLQNLNSFVPNAPVTIATAGTNTTLTPAQIDAGVVILTSGASGGFTITLPSTASIISQFGSTIPQDGTYAVELVIVNNAVGQTGTVTIGDASTTLSGTMTIATNTSRHLLLNITGPGTITITNFGSNTL